ncbi:hypothetical protein AGIG_G16447 [Arapaima gigas]
MSPLEDDVTAVLCPPVSTRRRAGLRHAAGLPHGAQLRETSRLPGCPPEGGIRTRELGRLPHRPMFVLWERPHPQRKAMTEISSGSTGRSGECIPGAVEFAYRRVWLPACTPEGEVDKERLPRPPLTP